MMLVTPVFLLTISYCTGYTLTTSSDKATVGLDYTFTCVTTGTFITFTRDVTDVCVITGVNTDGTCVFNGGYITDYTYTCNPTTNTYSVTIPGSYLTESLHGTTWKCGNPFGGVTSNTKILYVNVPVSSATLLSTPTDTNPVEVVSNRGQTFTCTTNAGRPSSRIQWYLSTINITTSASPQPDVCNTDCSDDKVISSSVLTYTGNINDDDKLLYCTAVNIEEQSVVRSSNKTIVIWYGPNQVIITPSTRSYTLKETENLNQIQCTADCIPLCTMTWSGPNFPAGTKSPLNLQNISRNQAGNYQCTASNDVSSKTSVVVNVVVQCSGDTSTPTGNRSGGISTSTGNKGIVCVMLFVFLLANYSMVDAVCFCTRSTANKFKNKFFDCCGSKSSLESEDDPGFFKDKVLTLKELVIGVGFAIVLVLRGLCLLVVVWMLMKFVNNDASETSRSQSLIKNGTAMPHETGKSQKKSTFDKRQQPDGHEGPQSTPKDPDARHLTTGRPLPRRPDIASPQTGPFDSVNSPRPIVLAPIENPNIHPSIDT